MFALPGISLTKQLRNYAWAIGTVCTYAVCSYKWEQYIAIVATNVVFLGLFTLFDYGAYLNLEPLKALRDHFIRKDIETVQDASVVVSRLTAREKIVLKIPPSCFIAHVDFYSAFKLHYLADDTDKFIASFSENIKRQFFVTFFLAIIIFVIFGGAGAPITSLTNSDADLNKVIFTAAATFINVLFLLRPFWYYRERNRSVLNV